MTDADPTSDDERTTDAEESTGADAIDADADVADADAATDIDAAAPEADGAAALLVASLAESTGKTGVTIALAGLAREAGEEVGYMKPKGTRLQSAVGKTLDRDPVLAREVLDLSDELSDLEPVVYSPTFVTEAIRGREEPADVRERVREAYETLAAGRDRMLLEGGGRLELGGVVDLTDPDVADLLDAGVVLLATYEEPGDVDDVLAAAAAFGDRLRGVVFNAVPDAAVDSLESDVVPFLEGRGVPVLGALPRVRTLAGVTVGDLAAELGAEVLVDEGLDAQVERFLVGAMGADSALRQFRRSRDAVVVTGGDRAAIHTAALEAAGVRCLLLTGGHAPSGAVLGRAAERGVPVLSVRTDTLTTVERAEDVVRSGRTRDAATVERTRGLLASHADVDGILGR